MGKSTVSVLAQRLAQAARLAPHNTRPEFVDEQWQLVAETIELMIDKAILELKIELVSKANANNGGESR